MTQLLGTQTVRIGLNVTGILDEDRTDLTQAQFLTNYRHRNIGAEYYQFPFYRLWPSTKFLSGDPVNGSPYLVGQDQGDGAAFETWSIYAGGAYRPWYVQGKITMADGVTGLSGAVVELFLTSTGQFVSNGVADTNGYYSLPTPFNAVNHFVYANYNSGQYVGASVNTLQPNA